MIYEKKRNFVFTPWDIELHLIHTNAFVANISYLQIFNYNICYMSSFQLYMKKNKKLWILNWHLQVLSNLNTNKMGEKLCSSPLWAALSFTALQTIVPFSHLLYVYNFFGCDKSKNVLIFFFNSKNFYFFFLFLWKNPKKMT